MKRHLNKWLTGVLAGVMLLSAAVPALAGGVTGANKSAEVTFTPKTNALEFDPTGMPSDFKFGSREIDLNDRFYPEISATPIQIIVNDLRGAGTGWNVSAKLHEFENVSNSQILSGATIRLRAARATITHTDGYLSIPATMPATVTLISGAVPTEEKILVATPVTTPPGAGTGTTKLSFAVTPSAASVVNTAPSAAVGIELEVKGASAWAGQYKAVMDWMLNDTP